ncbi:hypothetical protein [Kutzneria kofuensis]|uniref:hypothetical protein n=1 Tax=Kutzneria kofuensis TaxID=103725 RepID=UPI0031ECDB11
MFRRFLRVVAVGVLLAAVAVVAPAAAATAGAAAPTRIMALGDSITGSPGCWRALLWKHLQDTGHTNIDFVGTLPARAADSATTARTRAMAGSWRPGSSGTTSFPGGCRRRARTSC